MSSRTGGEIVADHLIAEGVPYVLGIPGHGDMGVFDAFKDRTDRIETIQVRHEQSAGHIADAYYRVKGEPLATITSIGPGSANMAMALATAYVDSQAMISITGAVQTYMDGCGVLQEIERQRDADFSSMLRPVVKRGFYPHRVDQVQRVMHRAFNSAVTGRPGPVHIELPIDVQSHAAEIPEIDLGNHRATHTVVHPDPDGIEQIAAILAGAKRPVILAGGGCIAARAHAELRSVAELLGAPVITTMMGKGVFPEDHPLCAQHTGANGTACGNQIARTADVILAIGTRFAEQNASSYQFGASYSMPGTTLLHVDVDPREIGKNYPTEVGVVSDARTGLAALHTALQERSLPDLTDYQAEVTAEREKWDAMVRGRWTANGLSLTKSLAALRELMPREGIVIASAGHPQIQAFQEYPAYEPRTWLTPGGYSTMGFTVPAAIGAKLAAPDVPVVGVAGDGDFLMTLQELALAVQLNLNVVYLVMNNAGWTSIRDFQRGLFGEDRAFFTEFRGRRGDLQTPDFTAIAQGFGATGIKVESFDQLKPALERALRTEGPVVVEAMQDRDPANTTGINSGYWDLPKPEYLTAEGAR
ncbi:thiamine pyrophosphate-binding protein [Conexibacter woesei]|uniref:Thiamine pyrophosphate protein central region n=1 Tax=Conexibacter woesei (strain DSM 14684 / CCUG 47730 / CIP 108061 / JCM 11494 / NBRC 100937 / ID131577) TaxID=469383 RepID=D3F4K6_CONWI|nr:thiamine pyrophosphate-binding protein [Conexibacter woesei]ADB52463.1 thiamine pyrophosphate protein central region [Conexibacter woesei DSM 14684]